MVDQLVEKMLKEALVIASKEHKMEILKTRIKICSPLGDGDAKYFVLDGGKELGEITLKKLLDIGIVDIMGKENIAKAYLGIALGYFAFNNEIPLNEANLRIFTKDAETKSPLICLFRKDELVKDKKEKKEEESAFITIDRIIEIYQEFEQQQEQAGES